SSFSYLFFSTILPPPRSTLFPYTTLFRSLVVAEEEQAVPDDWTAGVEAELVLAYPRLRHAARGVGRRVGVQLLVLNLVERLAAQRVVSALGDELDLHRALRAAVGGQPRGRDGDFFHRAEARRREREDARAAGSESLRVVVHAVERDVDGAAGQSVDVAVARRGRRRARRAARILLRAGDQHRKDEDAAAAERQLFGLRVVHGRRDRRRGGR